MQKVSIIQKDCRETAGSSVVGHAKVSNKQPKINQYLFMQLQNKTAKYNKKENLPHFCTQSTPTVFRNQQQPDNGHTVKKSTADPLTFL